MKQQNNVTFILKEEFYHSISVYFLKRVLLVFYTKRLLEHVLYKRIKYYLVLNKERIFFINVTGKEYLHKNFPFIYFFLSKQSHQISLLNMTYFVFLWTMILAMMDCCFRLDMCLLDEKL